jgi:hypothetical protein
MAHHNKLQFIERQYLSLVLMAAGLLSLGTVAKAADQQNTASRLKTSPAAADAQRRPPHSAQVKAATIRAERNRTHTTSPGLAVGKRDPFKLPEVPTARSGGTPVIDTTGRALPPGVRGLLISQLKLEGVVREQAANKMIAVVTNETKRAYFLTENESVYNGTVTRITPDAVYFKENLMDANGQVRTEEVVKRLGSAPGEGR